MEENQVNNSSEFKDLFSSIEDNFKAIAVLREKLETYTLELKDEYVIQKMNGVSKDLYSNSMKMSKDIISNLDGIQKNLISFSEDFFIRIKEFNISYNEELKELNEIKAEPLKKKAIETLRKNADSFYSIFESSLNKYL